MANRALDSLQQTLNEILLCKDDLTTHGIKQRIIHIHDTAVYFQLNLKHFPEEETIREVANTVEVIIQYLFSPENLSDCGSIEPAVRLSEQLRELAVALDSTAEDAGNYISSSSSSPSISGDDLTLPIESTIMISNLFGRLLEKFKSAVSDAGMSTELTVVGSSSTSALITKDDVMVGFDEYMTKDAVMVGFDEYITKDVVGFEEDRGHLLELLVNPSTRLQVLSIVGMGGIGKSLLAKIVYDEPFMVDRFDIRAWITISQDTTLESVVLNLLATLKGKTEQFQRGSEEIYQHFFGRRYLIVMDGVWSMELWGGVRRLFPDNGNGSRILLTTRLMNVANYCSNHIHRMHLLDEQKSWDLFQREVFADQTCPTELQPVAKKIVQDRGGLPLSIVKVARLLSKINDKTPKLWQQTVENDGQLGTIASSSYNDLPQHLRPCFLYMAAFPGDYEIHASELIKLWIAEGFLECSYKSKSLEEVGEAYLEDLIEKNVVLVTSKKIDGKIKNCKLHGALRDFCVRQAEEVKFLLPVMDYLPTPILRRHFLPRLLEDYRCISASWYDLDLKDSIHSSCTHSIICIPQKGYRPKVSVRNFSSLRVLHVLRRNDGSYWELGQVFDLIHLKYLASNIPTSIVPPTISNLKNLETLIIYRHDVCLPEEIWRLRRLKHLIAFSFCPLPHPQEEAFCLEDLQTLGLAVDFVCNPRMVNMIPNIRKLGICYSEEELNEGCCLDNLSDLNRLEKLKLERHSLMWPSLRPLFPHSLIKLTLSGWRLPWTDMEIVGWLPRLQVLKLRNYACDGECWETTYGGFQSLKLLLIDESNLQHWITDSSHFPRLQCLMLHRCPSLREILVDIGDIATLELIEIDDRNQSLLHSAKKIQEEQIESGNDDLQVQAVRL